MGEGTHPKITEVTVTDSQIKEIAEFVQIICDNPGNVIITPRLYAQHVTTMFLVIEHMKREVLDVACQTGDFKSFDRLCLYLESLGL